MSIQISLSDVFDLNDETFPENAPAEEGNQVGKSKKAATAEAIASGKHDALENGKPAPKVKGGTKPDQKKKASGGAQRSASSVPQAPMPKGVEKDLEIGELTFDPDFQKRTAIFDEHTVTEYEAIYADAKTVDTSTAHKALGALRAIDTGESLYVWDGFQRGEAGRRAGLDVLPVIVTKGTKEDAAFYALRANSGRGLSRSSNDCRRAVLAAINDPIILERIEAAKDEYRDESQQAAGLGRGLAWACGVSKGLVSKVLHDEGLTIRSGKIVKLPKPKVKPEPATPSANGDGHSDSDEAATEAGLFGMGQGSVPLTGQDLVDHLNSVNAHEGRTPEEQAAQIKATATKIILHEAKMLAAKLARICAGLLDRPEVRDILVDHALAVDLPIEVRTRDTTEIVESGRTAIGTQEYLTWTALESIVAVLEVTGDDVEKLANPPAPVPEPVQPATDYQDPEDAAKYSEPEVPVEETPKPKKARKSKVK